MFKIKKVADIRLEMLEAQNNAKSSTENAKLATQVGCAESRDNNTRAHSR